MNCPICKGRSIGRVGLDHYYCWDCFIEYQICGSEVRVYSVAEDGSLVDYEQTIVS